MNYTQLNFTESKEHEMAAEQHKIKLKKMAVRHVKSRIILNPTVTVESLLTNKLHRKLYKEFLEEHLGHVGLITTAATELLEELK